MSRENTTWRIRAGVIALALAAGGASVSVMAIEADQVRGEITGLSPEENRLELEVSEAGADRDTREGRTETYEIDEDTEIHMENSRASVIDPAPWTLDDLEEGTKVLLDFEEVDGRRMARNVSVESDDSAASANEDTAASGASGQQATDVAAMESDERSADGGSRSELPATSSALPAMALLGMAFAGVALLLRIQRR